MRTLPPLPAWLTLEHQVAQILTQQEIHGWYFDERAAWELESTLRREYEDTRKYYETGILSSKDQNLLLNELTEQKATLKALDSLN